MKKLIISIFIIAILLLTLEGTIFAVDTDRILEVPNFKIIMDGKLTEYADVPICTAGHTLLPLRELLVNHGVPNDDEHIIYNDNEKSVTVIKDQTRIYLKAGNKTAFVNDQPLKLDVAPVIYNKNQRTYIPLRFVAEALNKKVVWDGSAKAIFICDTAKFNGIKQILDRSNEAMKLTDKYGQTIDVDSNVKSE